LNIHFTIQISQHEILILHFCKEEKIAEKDNSAIITINLTAQRFIRLYLHFIRNQYASGNARSIFEPIKKSLICKTKSYFHSAN